MKTIPYHKLVRDRIPNIIRQAGKTCVTYAADPDEYLRLVDLKLREELDEYLASGSMEEMADLLEVIHAAAAARGSSMEEVEQIRQRKKEARGGFEKRIVLEEVREGE